MGTSQLLSVPYACIRVMVQEQPALPVQPEMREITAQRVLRVIPGQPALQALTVAEAVQPARRANRSNGF